jgi:hypothetical protein
MILSTRTGHSSRVLPKGELARPAPNGTQVRVLVAGIYNGVGHKALPKAAVGDIITVASGGYTQDLIACNLVTDALTEPEVRAVDDPPAEFGLGALEPWTFLEGAGLSGQLAQALYQAGFIDKATILKIFTDGGVDPFTAVKGVGPKTAERLIKWAAATEDEQ